MAVVPSSKIPRRHQPSRSCPVISYYSCTPTSTPIFGLADDHNKEYRYRSTSTATSTLATQAASSTQSTRIARTDWPSASPASASHTTHAHFTPYKHAPAARANTHARCQSSFLPRPSPRSKSTTSSSSSGDSVEGAHGHSRSTSRSYIPRASSRRIAHQSRWSIDLVGVSANSGSSSCIDAGTDTTDVLACGRYHEELAFDTAISSDDRGDEDDNDHAVSAIRSFVPVSTPNLLDTDTSRHTDEPSEQSTPATSPVTPSPPACRLRPFRLSTALSSPIAHLADKDADATPKRQARFIRPANFVISLTTNTKHTVKTTNTTAPPLPPSSPPLPSSTSTLLSSQTFRSAYTTLPSPLSSPSSSPFPLPTSSSCMCQWRDILTLDMRDLGAAELGALLEAGEEWLGVATGVTEAIEAMLDAEGEMF